MDEKILAVYGLSIDILHARGHAEDPQQPMSDAGVITTAYGQKTHAASRA